VGSKRLTTEIVGSREESMAAAAPQAVGERLLALVEPYPGAQRLVRRAWRSAQRLGGELDLLWVRKPGQQLTEDDERSLAALRQLASVLGARMLEEESDDVATAVADVAARRGTTYILIGRSRPARGLARLRVPLPQRLMQRLPGVDVRIVADRSGRASVEPQ
jgi:two-component system sensor histidine kinase KdpD